MPQVNPGPGTPGGTGNTGGQPTGGGGTTSAQKTKHKGSAGGPFWRNVAGFVLAITAAMCVYLGLVQWLGPTRMTHPPTTVYVGVNGPYETVSLDVPGADGCGKFVLVGTNVPADEHLEVVAMGWDIGNPIVDAPNKHPAKAGKPGQTTVFGSDPWWGKSHLLLRPGVWPSALTVCKDRHAPKADQTTVVWLEVKSVPN